jgi:hypothetical protein
MLVDNISMKEIKKMILQTINDAKHKIRSDILEGLPKE